MGSSSSLRTRRRLSESEADRTPGGGVGGTESLWSGPGIRRSERDSECRTQRRGIPTRRRREEDLKREMYDALSESKPGVLGSVTARSEPQVLRLSLVYALLDGARIISAP